MNLTERAYNYLKTLERDSEWNTSEEETLKYFKSLNVDFSKKVLETQLKYGGLRLEIASNGRFRIKVNFISKSHIDKKLQIYSERIDDDIIFKFDNGEKPNIYYITNSGAICSKDEDNPRKIHYTYENLNIKIEQYALLNEYNQFTYFSSGNYHVFDFDKLKTELSDFEFISECSDNFNFCCKNDQVLILVSPWLEGKGKYLNIYGINNDSWKGIIKRLQSKEIIE
ncbi:MAG: hypothetical protein KDC69_11090 [Flavobacteriaceae bacterium]|nr:hypothetical protein [Flavobacteriaceae bacterium]